MRLVLLLAAFWLLTGAPAQAQRAQVFAAEELSLRDIAAVVAIRTEERDGVSVRVLNAGPLPSPRARLSGRRLIVDGALSGARVSCPDRGRGFELDVGRFGRLGTARLPYIEVLAPRDLVLSMSGATKLVIDGAETAAIRLAGCGAVEIGAVADTLDLAVAGAMRVHVTEAGEASVRIAGNGDTRFGLVNDGLTASLAAGGDFEAQRVDGDTNIALQGTGAVTIRGGHAHDLSVVITGAGEVAHEGVADRLDAVILGGGVVHVREVTGPVERRVLGGGRIVIGR